MPELVFVSQDYDGSAGGISYGVFECRACGSTETYVSRLKRQRLARWGCSTCGRVEFEDGRVIRAGRSVTR